MTYFDSIIGQDSIKAHLSELVSRNALPHSLLFYGEAGLGKLDMAIGLASLLLGRQVFSQPKGTAYLEDVKEARLANGETEKRIEAEGLPIYMDKGDAFWIRPMKTTLKVDQWYSLLQDHLFWIRPMKTTLKVEQWYSLLQDHLSVAGNGNRVVIVEDFHTANAVMANAMLKTIEEPPEQVYFIIITNKINTVLPTIISRCMGVGFNSVDVDTIRKALVARGINGDIEQALLAGHGNPQLVEKLATQGRIEMLELAVKVMDILAFETRWFSMISLACESLPRESLTELMHWLRLVSRDMMALKMGAQDAQLQVPMYKTQLLRLLPRWSMQALSEVITETLQAERALRLHIKTALVVDGLSIALHDAREED